jgi:hypothetical protein
MTAPVLEGVAGDLLAVGERAAGTRSFLLVSKVLGKHIPVPAAVCRASGTALGFAVAGEPRGVALDAEGAVELLREAPVEGWRDSTVIGFAETATGLAHQVAEALDCAWLQNTSRHADCAGQISFDESHSHARNQWLRALPDDLPDGPLVIVDDELSTGATAAKLIALLHRRCPRSRYVLACLVDARRGPGPLEALSAELDVPIDVVSLGRLGDVSLPASGWSAGALPERAVAAVEPDVEDLAFEWPCAPERHGLDRPGRAAFREFAASLGSELAPGALVLGCGEHLALPQLAALAAGPGTLVSSTTRSPAKVLDEEGYPLRDGLAFPHPEDPSIPGYAYNVGERPHVVVHFAEPAHRRAADGLLRALAPASITAVTLR